MPADNQENSKVSESDNSTNEVESTNAVASSAVPAESISQSNNSKFKNFLSGHKKSLVLATATVLILLGGGAGAYYGVIVPSKPETKLKNSFLNLARKKQMTIDGKIDYISKDTSSDVKGFIVDFKISGETDKNSAAISGKVGVSGAQFPFDLRTIDNDVYFKVGGLDSLDKLIPATDETTATYLALASSINDQWFVIDRSFQQQAGMSKSCSALEGNLSFTEQDVNKFDKAYKKYPLFKVKSTSSETVDGVETTKMELSPANDATANKFANELTSLSLVTKIKDCLKDSGITDKVDKEVKPESESKKDDSKIFAYVTKDKQLKKLEISGEDETSTAKMSLVFNDKVETVTKPDGAKPIQELLSGLLGGFSGADAPSDYDF